MEVDGTELEEMTARDVPMGGVEMGETGETETHGTQGTLRESIEMHGEKYVWWQQ
jgi:hypothetical protein